MPLSFDEAMKMLADFRAKQSDVEGRAAFVIQLPAKYDSVYLFVTSDSLSIQDGAIVLRPQEQAE